MEQEINNLFKEDKPPIVKWLAFCLAGVAFIFIIILILLSNLSHFTFSFNDTIAKDNFLVFLLSASVGVIGSLVSNIAYDFLKIRHLIFQNRHQSNILKTLGEEDLLLDIFKDLHYYDNKYCTDYLIEAKIQKTDKTDELFICTTKYKYKKKLSSRKLIFQFVRITDDSEISSVQSETSLSESYLNNEYYYTFDERSYPKLNNGHELYKLNYLDIITTEGVKRVTPVKQLMNKDKNIVYEVTLDSSIDIKTSLIELEYEVICPIEKDYILYFTIELPTKGVRCEFDFAEVGAEIDMYAYDFLSSHRGPQNLHRFGENSIKWVKSGWILPKSSFVFVWFKK